MINNIYCIGRNYSEHAKELGNNVEAEPIIFSKPNSSLITNDVITLPIFSNDVHYETELVIKIAKEGFQIQLNEAETYYNEVAVGLDLTARDLQTKLKDKKLPWFLSKGFKDSCYVSSFISKGKFGKDVRFSMSLNGEKRQEGNTKDMIFNIPGIIKYLSQYIVLKPNDLIYTGTPKGVGQLKHGDQLSLFIENQKMADLQVK
ncbi:2-keto-4-pentenoate hydratase/2-oxohepta-3-ene-1 [Commensalibacter communis]|uniref:2-keto-4-pentenoate hydratase/2-oxohepta-3-ene-1 n=1 Tax=Commensalibacter communis TaxID=2972786 RepID=A0A9W4TM63_9PROT|nr:fumarylacetoacetate hydrolase family protein [Commensalibacter communis]CAI3928804.1 2-keto-4-pentenoate hydratase/2-oxohepta-3-ene-1 [Commensalibacter communis]CAI3929382.1 2-keto-4-pentenoate hydratase/2-oxohepta-3-ene-1 [Commensalibacter communis]CAI3932074.1 2-keto-4-pentenoate hydratase/2-oxohepta-3-ene-1 [Commensalibacter communis]CAI3933615.1 2-keto-4-pentenoate hydratase/2-oxohepta-3-ene-1 [Commensalibacter communis]